MNLSVFLKRDIYPFHRNRHLYISFKLLVIYRSLQLRIFRVESGNLILYLCKIVFHSSTLLLPSLADTYIFLLNYLSLYLPPICEALHPCRRWIILVLYLHKMVCHSGILLLPFLVAIYTLLLDYLALYLSPSMKNYPD